MFLLRSGPRLPVSPPLFWINDGRIFCWLFWWLSSNPKILHDVGHIRTFGALSAVASAAVLVHIIAVDPVLWTVMRIFTGFAYAGMFITVESWLNDKSTNETRGQMLAVYMIITMAGLGAGQLLGGLDNGLTNILFPMYQFSFQ